MQKKLNILLVECEEYFYSNFKRDNINEVMLPIGLMYLSSFIKKHIKNTVLNVKLVDLAINPFNELNKNAEIVDIIGIRGLTKNKEIVHLVARTLKEKYPHAKIIVGGPYISSDYKTALLDENIDFGVIGEGEYPFLEFVNSISQGDFEKIRQINGIAYLDKKNKKVIRNGEQEKPDLNIEPIPDYSIIDLEKYSNVICNAKVKRRQGVISASRGCPFKCIYCHKVFGKIARIRTAESVFREVKFLWDQYKIKDFFFVDDVFNLSAQRVLKFCSLIKDSGIKPRLYFQNGFRADICTREIIDACVEAGMILVNFALETSSPRLQKLIRKDVNIKKLREIVNYACSKNIIVGLNTMIGFPTETVEEAEDTIEFLRQFKKLTLPFLFIARYYPNTEMYNLAIERGADEEELKKHTYKVYHDTTLPTPTFSTNQLNKFYSKYMLQVFFDKERLHNCQKILQKYFSPKEICDFYSTLLNKKITNVKKEILDYARNNSKIPCKYI